MNSHLRSVQRLEDQSLVENLIQTINPDALEAQDIIQALYKSLKDRYGDEAVDVLCSLNEARQALEDLDRAWHVELPPDPCDLSRDEATRRHEVEEPI